MRNPFAALALLVGFAHAMRQGTGYRLRRDGTLKKALPPSKPRPVGSPRKYPKSKASFYRALTRGGRYHSWRVARPRIQRKEAAA